MSDGAIRYERDDAVAILTMDRPEKHNALTVRMLEQLWEYSREVESDPGIRVAVLTGAGDSAFCAGGDLEQLLPKIAGDVDDSLVAPDPEIRFFSKVYKPVVAAVNGLCIAGGLELMLGADLRVTSSDAVFGLAEVKWGIIPAAGSIVRLPRQIPWCIAMEMLLTGDPISAVRAHEVGLVNELVSPGSALDRGLEVAHRIARNGPLAARTLKRIAVDGLNLEPAYRLENALNRVVLRSEDMREGLAAFAENRPPDFEGR